MTIIDGESDPLRHELENSQLLSGKHPRLLITPIDIEKLRNEVTYLKLRLASIETQEKLKEKIPSTDEIVWLKPVFIYLVGGIVFLLIFSFLARTYSKDQVEITVNYEVGQIIGGVTIGAAALWAASAYSKKDSTASSVEPVRGNHDLE